MSIILGQATNFIAGTVANVPRPTATLTDVDLSFGFDGVTLVGNVSVWNPYPLPIPIGDITYVVRSEGNVIISGTIPDPGSLAAHGNTMLDVKATIPHNAVVSLVQDVGSDWDIDYVLEVGLIVDLPVIGGTLPLVVGLPLLYQLTIASCYTIQFMDAKSQQGHPCKYYKDYSDSILRQIHVVVHKMYLNF